jgi:uncharacterized protein (TIGR00369 family)
MESRDNCDRARSTSSEGEERMIERSLAPEGFVPYVRSSPYLDLVGPVYQSAAEPSIVRLLIDERHTNARGFLHAGVLVAVADTIMGHTLHRAAPEAPLLTVSLTTDFTGSAHRGEWLEGRAEVRRVGSRISFAACTFHVESTLVLTATGIFAAAPVSA